METRMIMNTGLSLSLKILKGKALEGRYNWVVTTQYATLAQFLEANNDGLSSCSVRSKKV